MSFTSLTAFEIAAKVRSKEMKAEAIATAYLDRIKTLDPKIKAFNEVFADRAYEATGQLVSRQTAGSVIDEVETVVARALRLIRDRTVVTLDGRVLHVDADTICIHGDTPGADRLAAAVRSGLEAAGITVRAVGQP